ncbi:MAG: TSUP family transporter [Burkholderiaceae bacterium]
MTNLLLANLVVLLGAFVQGAAGLGFAMVAVPLLALIDLDLVPGPAMIGLLTVALIMALQGRHEIRWPDLLRLLPGLVVGSAVGALLLVNLTRTQLAPVLGAIILIGVAAVVSGWRVPLNLVSLTAGGAAAGAMGTIAGIHGPPLAILFSSTRASEARAMIAWAFVLAALLSLASLWIAGRLAPAGLGQGLALLPGLLLGLLLARLALGRISPRWPRLAMLTLATLSGLLLIWPKAG